VGFWGLRGIWGLRGLRGILWALGFFRSISCDGVWQNKVLLISAKPSLDWSSADLMPLDSICIGVRTIIGVGTRTRFSFFFYFH
jgi:hypothetical protein